MTAAFGGCGKPSVETPQKPQQENPDDPGTTDQPDTTSQPQQPSTPQTTFPVDVRSAMEEAKLVTSVSNYSSYSPHSGVTVSEIKYKDYSGNLQAVFVMQVDLSDATVSMTNTVPGGATSSFNAGREKLSAQMKRIDSPGYKVIGGINTDFFTTTGDNAGRAAGIFWHNGTCFKDKFNSEANRPRCFGYWDSNKTFTLAASKEYSYVKSTRKLQEVFSGGQFMVRNGVLSAYTEDGVFGVHPRTLIGVTKDKTKVILVVLDGRNASYAVGMNYPDMQKLMKAVGSYDAINLDGGGSSTFIVRGEGTGYGSNAVFNIRNKPSDGSERAIGPGLAIIASD